MTQLDANSRSRSERLADELEQEILQQRAAPGHRLALRSELIERFGASAGAMNEALRILRERGVVSVRPGKSGGVFVAHPPPQIRLGAIDLWFREQQVDPVELFRARTTLEDALAAPAAERCTPEDAREFEWALEELRNARDDARAYVDANTRFHGVIVRAARIPVLAGMYDALATSIRTSMVRAEFGAHDAAKIITHNVEVHARLARAIIGQDHEALTAALRDHQVDLVRVDAPRGKTR